jgi:hypothetical protein
MKNCPKCGAINADNAEKCPHCDGEKAATAVAEPALNDKSSDRLRAVLFSIFWCGGGQCFKGEWLKAVLLVPVNLLFYFATFFLLVAGGDFEHPGALAKYIPFYLKVLCVTAPFWAWGLVDAFRLPLSSVGDRKR